MILLFFLVVLIVGDLTGTPEESFSEILLFEPFIEANPKNPELLYKLGKSYYDIHAWPQSIHAFEKVLKLNPNHTDAKVLLGYALLFNTEQDKTRSKELFQEVIDKFPEYEDAKVGLKKVNALLNPPVPFVMAQKEEKKKKKPHKKKGPKTSEILLERAKALSDQDNHFGAIEIYEYLVERFPKNAEYLFFLGREYVRADCRCKAKGFFERSLEIKPDYSDSLIFLGKLYLFERNFCVARDYFAMAVVSNQKDPAGFVGLAVVEALLDNPCEAEENFRIAYEIDPDNVDVFKPYADFLYNQRRYAEAETLYRIYEWNARDFSIYHHVLFDMNAYTTPTFFARAGTAQEREKDLFNKKWVASIRYYNTEVGAIIPICENFRITPHIRAGTMRQRLLQQKITQFDVKSEGGGIKGEWIIDSAWSLVGDVSMEWISNNHKPVQLPAKRGTLLEPTLVFRYQKFLDTVSFGELADSIVFRDFKRKHLRVVTRNAATFSYERDFEDYRYFGMNLLWIWYQDKIHNQEQDALLWFQSGFPYLEELFSARYACEYRHFYHQTTGYYTFQYQLTQWLRLRSFYRWLCGFRYEIEYWHGWRTTKGRNPQQQIVTNPLDQVLPNTTVAYQIDQVFLTLGYMPDDNLDIFLWGTYYHDSFDYTVMGAKIELDWRF